jgi:Cu+-exporting ATPase
MSDETRDPVCGMSVDPENAAAEAEWNGKLYSFCSIPCHAKFLREPAKYAEKTPPAPSSH